MSSNNPDITASDIITDVETRLGDTNLDTTDYLPWVSHAYNKVYHAIVSAGQQAKEHYFGDVATFTGTAGTAEYSLETNVPRFGGIIKVEILYGGSSDTYVKARRLPSLSNWENQQNVTTSYRSKTEALYYILGDSIGFIPTPLSTDSAPTIKVWYVKRPYQITAGTDVIDIPHRYQYALPQYVHAKATMAENEDYTQAEILERRFDTELMTITEQVANEFDENDDTNFIQSSNNGVFRNPLRGI